MQIIFRYDDFSAAPWVPVETDEEVFQLFLSVSVPLVVGLTANISAAPRNAANTTFYRIEDDAKRVQLLEEGLRAGWQLAVHGYTHQRTARIDGTEFSGLAIDAQQEKLEGACAAIDRVFPGARPTVFIPPWNRFDRQTIRCLEQNGFKTICGGNQLPWSWPSSINFVPSVFAAADFVAWIKRYSLAHLERMAGDAPVVVTFHHYEINDPTLAGYVGLKTLRETLESLSASGRIPTILNADMKLTMSHRLRYGAVMAKANRTGNSKAPKTENNHYLTFVEAFDGIGVLLSQAVNRTMWYSYL